MMNRGFYNEILTEHNIRPEFKHDLPDANIVLEGVNPNCGDDIWLKLKVENGIIEDGAFVGDGCAISQASADIMLGMIIGKSKDEALKLGNLFLKMIKGEATDEEIDELDEASALKDISHMPARVKCAVLGWHVGPVRSLAHQTVPAVVSAKVHNRWTVSAASLSTAHPQIFSSYLSDQTVPAMHLYRLYNPLIYMPVQ